MSLSERYYTRKDAVELIHETFGIKVPASRLDKDAMREVGRAPKPIAVYGRQHLYTRQQILDYGASLITQLDQSEAA